MDFTEIRYEVADRVATITLHRPDRMNAFTNTMMRELIEAFDRTDADDEVRAVIVTGESRQVAGIVTDGDVRRYVASNLDMRNTRVEEAMTADPITISDNTQAVDALSIMQRHEVTILPVVDGERRLTGILHLHDLLGKGEFRFLL